MTESETKAAEAWAQGDRENDERRYLVILAKSIDEARSRQRDLDHDTDLLNVALEQAEKAIKELKLGVRAEVAISDDARLVFSKRNNIWALSIERKDDWTPVCNASRAERLLVPPQLGHLVSEMCKMVATERDRVLAAVACARRFTEGLPR